MSNAVLGKEYPDVFPHGTATRESILDTGTLSTVDLLPKVVPRVSLMDACYVDNDAAKMQFIDRSMTLLFCVLVQQ